MERLESIQRTQKRERKIKTDKRSFENILKAINTIIEQLLKFQERMQKKDLSELRTIAEGIFNIENASFYNKEELIVEIVKARAKMLEPKKKKNKKNKKEKKEKEGGFWQKLSRIIFGEDDEEEKQAVDI